MLKSFKEKIYTLKETIHGFWYTLKLKDNDSWETIQEIQRPERDKIQAEINRRCSMSMQRRIAEDLRRKAMREQRPIIAAEQRFSSSISSNSSIASYAQNYKTDYRVCRKHSGHVFYDLKKHFECPMCVEEREKIQITDFLTESDMQI